MTLAGVKREKGINDSELESMFNLPRDEAHGEMKKHKDLTMPFSDPRVQTTTSFLVSRNPYSRLFSSYIDQIFLPNKWKQAASMVSKRNNDCGNDVTFNEFLKSISDTILKRTHTDLHWAPIFSICLPCESNIDLLAKQETFKEDADFILDQVGVSKAIRDEVDNAIGENIIENSLQTLVHTYVTKGHSVKSGCITEKELAERLWTAFQIQGYIHNQIKFPENKFKTVSKSEMEPTLLSAVLNAVNSRKLSSEEREAQRHAWKVHFWKQVSPETLNRVQDAYYEDFYIFGYDLDPSTM